MTSCIKSWSRLLTSQSTSRLLTTSRSFMTTSPLLSPIVKSVAIIGGGPSGAGAAKAFAQESYFDKIKIFEKRSLFGGLWNYTHETDATTTPVPCELLNLDLSPVFDANSNKYIWPAPVYDLLDTNVPKDIMTYSDFPFPDNLPLFPHRSDVLKYVTLYAQSVEHLTSFDTKVVNVELIPQTQQWQVTSRPVIPQTNGGAIESNNPRFADLIEIFDAVVIAIGNYDVPYIPNRPGLTDWNLQFPNSIQHVKSYRNPQQYAHAKGEILIVGNLASGGDLAFQLLTNLNRIIYKLKRSDNLMPAGASNLIHDVPDIDHLDPLTKSVYFKDGSKLSNVEYILFATGYLKSYPFLKLPADKPPLLTDGFKVHGIYEHLLCYNYPHLAIVGLPRFVLPTRTSETQGCWISKVWSNKIKLPPVKEMEKIELDRINTMGNGKFYHDLVYPEDVQYCNRLNNQILDSVADTNEKGLIPKIWDKEQTALRGSIKNLKEAYIQYKLTTGKNAQSYQELIDAKIIDNVLISDEELASNGFDFDETLNSKTLL